MNTFLTQVVILTAFSSAIAPKVPASNSERSFLSAVRGQLFGPTEKTDLQWVEMDVSLFAKLVQFWEEYPRLARMRAKEERAKGNEKDALAHEGLAFKCEIMQAIGLDRDIVVIDHGMSMCKRLIESAKYAGNRESTAHREELLKQLQEIRSKMLAVRANSVVYRAIKSPPHTATQACRIFVIPLLHKR